MRYAIVIERGETNFSAYIPDLPGCVSTGNTLDEVRAKMQEAIRFHIDGMIEDGEPVPPPSAVSDYVEADAA